MVFMKETAGDPPRGAQQEGGGRRENSSNRTVSGWRVSSWAAICLDGGWSMMPAAPALSYKMTDKLFEPQCRNSSLMQTELKGVKAVLGGRTGQQETPRLPNKKWKKTG